MSTSDWLRLGPVIYGACFTVVIMSMHHGDFRSRIQEPRTRRTIGISALVLAPLSLVVGILALFYIAARAIGREVASYAGFDDEPIDTQ
jgi:hypothetical protein